jgi:hypothetical protein
MKRMLLLSLFSLVVVFPYVVTAQPVDEVRIVHVDTKAFPTVRVHVRAFCGGQQSSNINQVTVRIYENGVFRTLQSMTCPSQTEAVSVALALDRSASVAGTTILRIKEGAWRFVELFQQHGTGQDEGAIFSFGSDVTMHTGMTSDWAELADAINNVYPYGLTAMYDAIIDALNEVHNNGSNALKAVVVLTDGDDNNSTATLSEVISRAQQLGIPVYCVGISYVEMKEPMDRLRQIADMTGGVFIEVNHPDDIVPAFNSMMSMLTNGGNDCIMTYTSECPDGTARELKVIAEACGLSDTAVVHFKAPLDPNLPVVSVWFDSTAALENGEMLIPVMIDAPAGTVVNKLILKAFERPPIQYQGVVKDGYLADMAQLLFGRVADSVIIELTGPLLLSGRPDTLLKIRYRTPPTGKDTSFTYPAFYVDKETMGCLVLKAWTNRMTILKRPSLDVACDDIISVEWDDAKGNFVDGIVRVGVNITNRGSFPVRNTRVRVIVPPGMELVSPSDNFIISAGGLPVQASEYAYFELRALPVEKETIFLVCLEVQPDSGLLTTCCTQVRVAAGKALLQAECEMIHRVQWSDSLETYVPEVFPVRVRILNRSELPARNVEARLILPEGFEIEPGTPLDAVVNPDLIGKADTGYVTWLVRPLERSRDSLFNFCVEAVVGADTVECCDVLYITRSPIRADLQCTEPIAITLDEGTGKYEPTYMFIRTTVRNTSRLPMTSARGQIQLPPFLRLGGSEFQTKEFPTGGVIAPGDSGTLSWVVELIAKPTDNASVCVNVTAENYPGAQCCTPLQFSVENAIPSLTCTLEGPDTIRYVNGGYIPQPASITVRVRNTGATPAMQVSAALLQGGELSIDDGDSALKLVSDSLAAGASADAVFRVRILDRPVGRTDTVRVTVYAANGGGALCSKLVYIEAVSGPVLDLSCDGPDSLVYNDAIGAYEPEPFLVSVDVRNIGTAPADSIIAEILPPPDMTLAAGEQPAKLLTPSALGTGESGIATWFVRSTARNEARLDTIRVQVRAKGKTLQQTVPCEVIVFVPAARTPALELSCQVMKQAVIDDTVIVAATLENRGSATAHDIALRIQLPPRLTLSPADQDVLRTLTALGPGQTHSFGWRLIAARGATADSVVVCFEADARFHATRRCCATVYIPALDAPSFASTCSLSADTLRFDEAGDRYPEVRFMLSVTNTSTTVIDSVLATIALPSGMLLATGETMDRIIRDLAPAASKEVVWRLTLPRDSATVIRAFNVGVRLYGLASLQSCERELIVFPPPHVASSINVTCHAPDTLFYLGATSGYRPGPFPVRLDIINNGVTTLSGLRATLSLPAEIAPEVGEQLSKLVGMNLDPGERTSVVWLCRGLAQTGSRVVQVSFTAQASGVPARSCTRDILLFHPPPVDSASMSITCIAPDSIRVDRSSGELRPSPFPVSVNVFNNGNTTLTNILVGLRMPSHVVLAAGESSSKPLGFDLPPGSSGSVTFSCVASLPNNDIVARFGLTVSSAQTAEQECLAETVIEGRLLLITLRVPDDIIGVVDREFHIPVLLGNVTFAEIESFDFELRFDTRAVRVDGVAAAGTLTSDWTFDLQPTPTGVRIIGQGGRNIVESGALLRLRATGMADPERDRHFGVYRLPVDYAPLPMFGPRIDVLMYSGVITISGDCVEPLKANIVLQQNAPNPFNPSTVLRYRVDAEVQGEYGVLEVLDAHGRRVRVLHEGPLAAGSHELVFDAGELPSGLYLLRLRAGGLVLTRKMLLAK